MSLHPKIYIACLSSYSAGILHGVWLDADLPLDKLRSKIDEILRLSTIPNAEEWDVHDTSDFDGVDIQAASLGEIGQIADFIRTYGRLGAEILKTVRYESDYVDRAHDLMEECYQGSYDSAEDFARDLIDACGDIPELLMSYMDYELIARDLLLSDYFAIEVDHKVHVFNRA